MSFRRLLVVILVIVISLLSLMLSTSYAWYAYNNASTKFDVVTANENVEVVFQSGEYINTENAIPIKAVDVDRYSDKHDFSIKVKKASYKNEMVASISLTNIVIDDDLKVIDDSLGDSPFKVELFYQGSLVGRTISGKEFDSSDYEVGNVVLDNDIVNEFELRFYLLDNGGNQDGLMDKKFQAKIVVNVVSREAVSFVSFDNPDIVVSGITIDGKSSKYLPVDGFYQMSSSCEKGSKVSWDYLNKALVYDKGSYFNDKCKLTFVKMKKDVYLKDMAVGSYVKYVGNNGCSGNSCQGENVNYVDDGNMGHCGETSFRFLANGWRIGYIDGGKVALVSAGAVSCLNEPSNEELDKVSLYFCNPRYVVSGSCNKYTVHSLDYEDMLKMKDELIYNGSYYWYSKGDKVFSWNPELMTFDYAVSSAGLRPVIYLDSKVKVVGGSGTYEDPFVI